MSSTSVRNQLGLFLIIVLTLATAPPVQGQSPTGLIINEIDYDQPSTDQAEFIELKNVGQTSLDLGGYDLILVDGGQTSVYRTINLPTVELVSGDYYVVCGDPANVPNCDLDASPNSNLIQNGAPDAVALLLDEAVIDAISYEGDVALPYTEGSGVGLTDSSTQDRVGLSRFPDGVDSDQNNIDFSLRCITPGAANVEGNTDCVIAETTAADLALTLTDSSDPVIVGDMVTYLINLSNNGPDPAQNVSLSTTLPSGVTFVSAASGQGACSEAGGVVSCTLAEVGVGATVPVEIMVSTTTADLMTITVSVSAATDDPNLANNSASEETVVETVPSEATLVINEIDYDQPGADAAEFIELKNMAQTVINLVAYTVALVDGAGPSFYRTIDLPAVDLGPGSYYVICGNPANVANCDLDVSPNSNLIQNGGPDAVALLLNETVIDTVSYEGDTGPPYTEGSGVGLVDSTQERTGLSRSPDGVDTDQNNIDLSLRCITPGVTNAEANVDCTPVVEEADLIVTLTDSIDPVVAGDEVTYLITVSNEGPDPANNVTLVDNLPAGVNLVSITPDSGSCAEAGNIISCDLGEIPNGESVTVQVVITAPTEGVIINMISVTADTNDPVSDNNTATEETVVEPVVLMADLAITLNDELDPVMPSDNIVYLIEVTNNGPAPATEVIVIDNLPTGVTFISAEPDQGGCSETGGVVTCNLGDLASGGSAKVTVVISTAGAGLINNDVSVGADTGDPILSNNSASEETTVEAAPEIINSLLNLSHLTTAYYPGDERAQAGVFTISATFDNISSTALKDLFFKVITLTPEDNILLNADDGPGGAGAIISVPSAALGEDSRLLSGHAFTIDFEIGLTAQQPFRFLVDAYGVPLNTAIPLSTSRQKRGFQFEVEDELFHPESLYIQYLPFIVKSP